MHATQSESALVRHAARLAIAADMVVESWVRGGIVLKHNIEQLEEILAEIRTESGQRQNQITGQWEPHTRKPF